MSDHYNSYGYYGAYGQPGNGQQGPGQSGQFNQSGQPYQPGQRAGSTQYGYDPYFGHHSAPQYGPQHGAQYGQPGAAPANGLASWYNFRHPDYLKGLLLGAGAALLLTNPTAQKALIGGAVRVWAAVQGGIEEIKEQIEDVKAELSREE